MTAILIPPLSPFPGRGAAPEDYIAQADTTMQELPGAFAKINEISAAFNLGAGVLGAGYGRPVLYVAGLAITTALQAVEYNNVTYAPILGALPFTTSGAFEADKFRVIQGVTADALAQPTGAGGVGMQQVGDGSVPRSQEQKNADIITVQDYGAAVDGMANDTIAVMKAMVTGQAQKVPVVVPKRAKHSASLVGCERVKTVFSEPWETDYIARYMNEAYVGTGVDLAFFGDSTGYGSDPLNLANQVAEPSPMRLQAVLRRFFANDSIVVYNYAIAGTTVRQMLAGTDGSGKTFEERVAASPAKIVYVNHCINSCQLGDTADSYKRDMHTVAEICRKYGRSPVFTTPNPMAPVSIGDRRKTIQLSAYAEAMRQVSREAGVPLVDNWTWITKILATGRYSVLDVIPDGCHPTAFMYTVMGQNLAIPLLCPDVRFTGPDQFLAAMSAQVLGSAAAPVPSKNSRMGGGIISGGSGAQSVRMAFVVDEGGLDVYVAVPVWPSGATTASITVDRVLLTGAFSFRDTPGRAGGRFVQDHEIRVIENARPGLHFIEFEATEGAVGAYYLRTRRTRQERAQFAGAAFNYRQPLLANFEINSTAANSMVLLDAIPTPRLDAPFRLEVTATWQVDVGVVLSGLRIADNGATSALSEAGFIIGLDSAGKASVWENIAGVQTKLLTGATVYTGTRQTFYIRAAPGRFGTIELYVNSASVGVATITQAYWGGVLGVWRAAATGSWMVERVDLLVDPIPM